MDHMSNTPPNVYEITMKPQDGVSLIYTMIGEDTAAGKEKTGIPEFYSLKIRCVNNSENGEIYIQDIARDVSSAKRLVCLLAKEFVTPETAEYIIEEIISFGIEKYL